MPTFDCDLTQQSTPFSHPWEHTVGSGHAPLGLRADWQSQLRQCNQELGFRHVRFHGILSDPMGTLICQNEEFLYSFFNADQVIDFLLAAGMRPFVELSLMPTTLASGDQTVFRYQGNVTPPRDLGDWSTLIDKLVRHWVGRYGVGEVSNWFFEVWNEPNLHHFWTGDQGDYFELYRHTAETIKQIDDSLKVGGPATAQNAWIPAFLEFCHRNDLPADFITTHYYPTDAFGEIGADSDTQLENAPRDVMRRRAQEARDEAGTRGLYYTEWNTSSNPRHAFHDRPASAAFATRIIMSVRDLVDGYSFWTFSDIFEENYFPSTPFHGGFGLLNLHGVAKPVYRAFELLHRLGDESLVVAGDHETVEAWAVRKGSAITILMVNDVQPRHPIRPEKVTLRLANSPQPNFSFIERIDEHHANPERLWREMGEPEYPSYEEIERLQRSSEIVPEPVEGQWRHGVLQFSVDLAENSVTALTVDFGSRAAISNEAAIPA